MNQARRLQSAQHWLATQSGRTAIQIAKSYRKRFGVDWPCAVRELSALGVRLDPEWVMRLDRALVGAQHARRKRREDLKNQAVEQQFPNSDEYLAYIAGYTPGDAPFGITWEEWRQMERESLQASECPF
jgi:hypothetical protein